MKFNDNFTLKNTVPDRKILPDISKYAHLVKGNTKLIAGSVETTLRGSAPVEQAFDAHS